MAHYGMNYGAYIVVPILGSSTPRDLFGRVVDAAIDPTRLLFVNQLNGTTFQYGTATSAQTRIKNDQLLDDISQRRRRIGFMILLNFLEQPSPLVELPYGSLALPRIIKHPLTHFLAVDLRRADQLGHIDVCSRRLRIDFEKANE